MALGVESLTFDCRDPRVVAPFWAEVLGYEVVEVDDEPTSAIPRGRAGGSFLVGAVKNRLHLDLRPVTSMAEEKARVATLGAREFRYVAEEGSFWTVMLDPEGNEFCVLRGPDDGWTPKGRDV